MTKGNHKWGHHQDDLTRAVFAVPLERRTEGRLFVVVLAQLHFDNRPLAVSKERRREHFDDGATLKDDHERCATRRRKSRKAQGGKDSKSDREHEQCEQCEEREIEIEK